MGPYLTPLFERAFIDGLHDANKRPTADEWESARLKQSI
uniref:Kinase protein n=1 Tax=Escherichia coli TaxID=562 RepID=A0A6G9HIW9_ECOLX|nr:Putative kinase protein [Escherichia coli]